MWASIVYKAGGELSFRKICCKLVVYPCQKIQAKKSRKFDLLKSIEQIHLS